MLSKDDLDRLITREAAPAVTLLLPTHVAGREIRQDPIRLRRLVDRAAALLTDRGMRHADAERFLAPARALVEDGAFWRKQDNGLAVFLAPGVFQFFKVPVALPEEAVVGRHFHIRHLLPALADGGRFLVLAVSAAHARLFDGDRHGLTARSDIGMPEGVGEIAAETEYEDLTHANPATRGRNAAHGGIGRTQNFGEGPEELRKTELIEYLRRVVSAIEEHAKTPTVPIVLVAQPEIQGHIRALAKKLPNLTPSGLLENPDSLGEAELHRRAYAVVAPQLTSGRAIERDRLDQALNDGSGRATTEIAQIIPAARDGRVDTLFLAAEDHVWGRIEERAESILVRKSDEPAAEDLLDDAAIATLLKGGRVEVLPKEEMPESGAAAAIFRY